MKIKVQTLGVSKSSLDGLGRVLQSAHTNTKTWVLISSFHLRKLSMAVNTWNPSAGEADQRIS